MKKAALTVVAFLFLGCMVLSSCAKPTTDCEKETQKLERLLGELDKSSSEYSFNNLRLQFLIGNSHSRLAICKQSSKHKALALEAYDNALKNFHKGVDIIDHQDARFLSEKVVEHRARTARLKF